MTVTTVHEFERKKKCRGHEQWQRKSPNCICTKKYGTGPGVKCPSKSRILIQKTWFQ